ncbi:MAG: hypothetical protein QOK38_819 [Acidobacteriaceae bacterium]|nr:hypothetical protein [Acidobacteriaceae bacterium]
MSSPLVTALVSFTLAACPMAHAQAAASTLTPAHNRQYFRDIAAHHFSVPAGASAFTLAQELTPWLASPDPELRDTLAYTTLDVWIRHAQLPDMQFTDAQLLTLLPSLQHNLTAAIGESGTDSVFKRSFSALTLASFAERDLQQPFLSPAQYRDLLASALAYLRDERDTRGFDPTKGWIHSTAHTADLLAALARNPHFTVPDQQALFTAVEQRLHSAGHVYTFGEQDRLAVALLCVITRDDFQLTSFQKWLDSVQQDGIVWQKSPPDPVPLALFENHTYLLEALLARMPTQTPLSPAATQARDAARAALRKR